MTLKFALLGPLEIRLGGERVEIRGPRRRALLAYFLVHAGEPQPLDRVVEALWGDSATSGSAATVQTYVSQFRKLFASTADGTQIVHRSGGYVFGVSSDAFDGSRFEAAVGAASGEGDAVRRLRLVSDAIALWRGAPLDEFAGQAWADERARQWTRLYLLAQELRADALLDTGDHRRAVPVLEQLVAQYPLQERLWAQLIVARYRCGRQADALAAAREARHALVSELGIDPGPELVDLERRVLSQDPTLDSPPVETTHEGRPPVTIVEPLPGGVVTFLLTDIESSTRLWDEHAGDMAKALVRHEDIILDVIQAHAGRLLKSRGEGDATLSVFASATDAVAAAVTLQRRLQREGWPGSIDLKTRVALHTGEAQLRDGDYYGGTLNRAARIRGLAAGGEILTSRATHDLVVDTLPDDVTLVELGAYAIKGLRRQETLYLLGTHGSEPTRDTRRRVAGSPMHHSGLVGRDGAVERVLEAVSRPGLVTITGPGGIGKTRLMHEVWDHVERGEHRFERVWMVELAGASGAVAVESALHEALAPESAGLMTPRRDAEVRGLAAEFAAAIGAHRGLLVLDNCEHVLDSLEALVTEVVGQCGGLSVLATSRQPLGVKAERVIPLAPLEIPAADAMPQQLAEVESMRLLRDRVHDAGGDIEVTEVTVGALAQLCRQLDGIPLALELAAARLDSTTPQDLVSRLSRQIDVLSSKRGDPRHRTLHRAIDWSYQLLADSEQVLLRRLGIFVGGFTLDAAETVCVDEPIGLGIDAVYLNLAELVSKSLVGFDRERARYRLLEPVRFFAREQLEDAGEADAVARRHAQWVVSGSGPLLARWLREEPGIQEVVRADLDNMHAALDWLEQAGEHDAYLRIVAALGFPWSQTDWRRGRAAADRALNWLGDARPRLRAGVLLSRGILEQRVFYHDSAAWLREAREIYREIGDRFGLAWATFFLGRARFFIDDVGLDALMAEAVSMFRAIDMPFGVAWGLVNLGVQANLREELDVAQEHFAAALVIADELGHEGLRGLILGALGGIALARGEIEDAREALRYAIALQRDSGGNGDLAGQLTNSAWVEVVADDLDAAKGFLRQALRCGIDRDHEWAICESLLVLGVVHLREDDPERARRMLAATGWDVDPPNFLMDLTRSMIVIALRELAPIFGTAEDSAREGRRLGPFNAAREFLAT